MRLSPTLSFYVGRQFLLSFLGVFVGLLTVVFLFYLIELLRRAATLPAATLGMVIRLSLLKQPKLAQEMIPFVVLFSAMIAFFRLARTQELTVVRAAGVSVWQFLLPVVTGVLIIGAFTLAVINPVSAVLYARYEQLEAQIFRGQSSMMAVSSAGGWLGQAAGSTHPVVHPSRVNTAPIELQDRMTFTLEGADHIVRRSH